MGVIQAININANMLLKMMKRDGHNTENGLISIDMYNLYEAFSW